MSVFFGRKVKILQNENQGGKESEVAKYFGISPSLNLIIKI